jgi:hypothetical protein
VTQHTRARHVSDCRAEGKCSRDLQLTKCLRHLCPAHTFFYFDRLFLKCLSLLAMQLLELSNSCDHTLPRIPVTETVDTEGDVHQQSESCMKLLQIFHARVLLFYCYVAVFVNFVKDPQATGGCW